MENWKEYQTDGLHNGQPIYCPVNAYGDCPYCDEKGVCRINDPIEECSDFGAFFESWEDWEELE